MTIYFNGECYTISQLAEKYCTCERNIYKLISECTEKELERKLTLHRQKYMQMNKTYEYKGKKYTLKEIAKATNIRIQTVRNRINMGWNIEDVFEVPVMKVGEKRKK